MLFDVLLQFCVWNIGLTVDILNAYLQIAVSPTEHDYLQFLWYDDVTKKGGGDNEILFNTSHLWCSQFLLDAYSRIYDEIDRLMINVEKIRLRNCTKS